jgi:NADPH:quinone reductase-like Zn-dependent oxidoreductase
VQLAKARCARVIGSASSEREDYVRGLGADVFVDDRSGDSFELGTAIIGAPLDAVADLVGQGSVAYSLD